MTPSPLPLEARLVLEVGAGVGLVCAGMVLEALAEGFSMLAALAGGGFMPAASAGPVR